MYTELKKQAKALVKLNEAIEAAHERHTKKRKRLQRRVDNMLDRMINTLRLMFPVSVKREELYDTADKFIDWMSQRRKMRYGCQTQRKVPRSKRPRVYWDVVSGI